MKLSHALAGVAILVFLLFLAAMALTPNSNLIAKPSDAAASSWRIVRADGVEMVVVGLDCKVGKSTDNLRLYCWTHGSMSMGEARRIIQVIDIEEIKPNE